MPDTISFTITERIELNELLELTDDDNAKELIHDAYLLPEDIHYRLAELKRMRQHVVSLSEQGVQLEGCTDNTELTFMRRLLGRALYTNRVELSEYDRDRISIILAVLVCIEFEYDTDELLGELDQSINRIQESISPF